MCPLPPYCMWSSCSGFCPLTSLVLHGFWALPTGSWLHLYALSEHRWPGAKAVDATRFMPSRSLAAWTAVWVSWLLLEANVSRCRTYDSRANGLTRLLGGKRQRSWQARPVQSCESAPAHHVCRCLGCCLQWLILERRCCDVCDVWFSCCCVRAHPSEFSVFVSVPMFVFVLEGTHRQKHFCTPDQQADVAECNVMTPLQPFDGIV